MVYAYACSFASRAAIKTAKTRLLMLAFVSLTFWAMCFAISNAAPDEHNALLWRKIGVLGWGTIYSFVLHLTLAITGKTKLLKSRLVLFAIYLPAAISIVVFLLVGPAADRHYNLQPAPFGWINLYVDTIWNTFHTAYFAVFTGLSMLLLLHKWLTGKAESQRRKARALLLSFAASAILGSLTDFVFVFEGDRVPQMGILFILLPTMTFFYLIVRHSFLETYEPFVPTRIDQILNDRARGRIYNRIGYLIHFVSFLNLANRLLIMRDFSTYNVVVNAVLFSALLITGGTLIIHAQQFHLSIKAQEWILAVVVNLSLAAGVAAYAFKGAVVIWALVFPFIVVSVVFSNPLVIPFTALIQVLVQIALFYTVGLSVAGIQRLDYLVRVLSIVSAAVLAYYTNRVYHARLTENDESIRFQRALADLALSLRSYTQKTIESTMPAAIRIIAQYLPAKRVLHLMLHDGRLRHARVCHSSDTLLDEAIPDNADLVYSDFLKNRPVGEQAERYELHCDDIQDAPALSSYLRRQGIQTVIYTPFMVRNDTVDYLLVELEGGPESFSAHHNEFFSIATLDLSNYMLRAVTSYELQYLAYHDQLTGLYNRNQFLALADQRLRQVKPGAVMAILFMDVDAFKEINDSAGHDVGNRAIRAIADRLISQAAFGDYLGRYGGDEFLMLISRDSVDQVERFAEQVLASFDESYKIGTWEFFLTASIDIALYPQGGKNAQEMLTNADFAMFEAKYSGKNRAALYSTEKKTIANKAFVLKNSLRNAIERKELFIEYQPQVSLRNDRIVGVEALLRWQHPVLGRISPADFIPIAEESGLIIQIGEIVLKEACGAVRRLIDQGLGLERVGVNFSYQQVVHPGFVDMIKNSLHESRLRPHQLEIEITESTTGKHGSQIAEVVLQLRELGVLFAIDDYGADYSALNRLSVVAVDRIKIDKSLVDGIVDSNPRGKVIIHNIITLARQLGVSVIAEGVEAAAQVEYLRTLNCDEIQGYYYYKPLSLQALEQTLARGAGEGGAEG